MDIYYWNIAKKDAQKTVEKGAKMGFYHIRTWNIWSIYAYKAPEKMTFGADTPIYDQKRPKKDLRHRWGGRGRKFKSCHSDHKGSIEMIQSLSNLLILPMKNPL